MPDLKPVKALSGSTAEPLMRALIELIEKTKSHKKALDIIAGKTAEANEQVVAANTLAREANEKWEAAKSRDAASVVAAGDAGDVARDLTQRAMQRDERSKETERTANNALTVANQRVRELETAKAEFDSATSKLRAAKKEAELAQGKAQETEAAALRSKKDHDDLLADLRKRVNA